MPGASLADLFDDRREALPVVGQRVLHARWDFGEDLAVNDAVALELAELLSENLLGDLRNRLLKVAEAAQSVRQPPPDPSTFLRSRSTSP